MNRHKLIPPVLVLAALACATTLAAQTPANISPLSGNGQMICNSCSNTPVTTFQALVANVTDVNGNPIAGTAVNWSVTAGGTFGVLTTVTSYTDNNGNAISTFFPTATGTGSGFFNPFVQTTVTATAGGTSTNFYLTQVLPDGTIAGAGNPLVTVTPVSSNLNSGSLFSGPAGTTGQAMVVNVNSAFSGVPNVAVNLFNLQCASATNCPTGAVVGPTVQCAASTGAGPGTVLTNPAGQATCNPVFGSVAGQGQFDLLVGASLQTNPTTPQSAFYLGNYAGYGPFTLSVTSASPTALQVVSGSGQQAQAGQALSLPLLVKLITSGGAGLSGQPITWSVSPSGAATLGSNSSTTDVNGQASTTVTLSSNASGTVTVTATATGTTLAPATFTITAIPLITATGMTIVSGNNQTIAENAQSAPLTVQVNASNGGVD